MIRHTCTVRPIAKVYTWSTAASKGSCRKACGRRTRVCREPPISIDGFMLVHACIAQDAPCRLPPSQIVLCQSCWLMGA